MTVSSTNRKAGPYVCNGTTSAFPFSFKVFSADDLRVVKTDLSTIESDMTLSSDFTVTLNADQDGTPGGTVTMNSAPDAGFKITITSVVASLQPVVLTNAGGFYPTVINGALDRLTIMSQQLAEQVGRAVKTSISSSTSPDDLMADINTSVGEATSAAAAAQAAADAFGGDTLAVEFGGTGANTPAEARTALELGDAATKTIGAGTGQVPTADMVAGLVDKSSIYDQIALMNLRLMLNTNVATGALAQGRQWELATDEWAASSADEVYVSGAIGYYTNVQSTLSSTSGLTKIGDMTSGTGGGIAAAFDGSESQTETTSSRKESANVAYVGLDWGSGNAKKVSAFWIKGSYDQGFVANINPTVTVTIQGSSDNFASSVVDLGSASDTDSNSLILQNISLNTATAYRYHRAKIEHNGAPNPMLCAELKLYEFAVTDVTLIQPASVSSASAPAYVSAYMLHKDDDGSAVLGTDLTVEISRDGGTTYATATITTVAAYDSSYTAIKARADVSAQPSGTSLLMRVKTLNTKAQRIAAPAIYAE